MNREKIDIPKINDSIVEKIVDGIRLGYIEYLDEIIDKSGSGKIYSGYRWTKSNHIDNNIREQLTKSSTIEIHRNKIKSNGWQFNSYVTDQITFIQKPISYINDKSNFKGMGKENGGYISILSNKTNKSLFQDLGIQTDSISIGQIELLDTFNDNSSDLFINSGVFYLVTYNIGSDKNINKIEVYAACNGQCIRIQDLSEANSASIIEIPRDLLDQVTNEDAIGYEHNSNFYPDNSKYNSLYNNIKINKKL